MMFPRKWRYYDEDLESPLCTVDVTGDTFLIATLELERSEFKLYERIVERCPIMNAEDGFEKLPEIVPAGNQYGNALP